MPVTEPDPLARHAGTVQTRMAQGATPMLVRTEPGYPLADLDAAVFRTKPPRVHIRPEYPLTNLTARQLVGHAALWGNYTSASVILDGTHGPVQDVLLKFIEEPPREMAVVLFASLDQRVNETILSRCFVLRLDPLDTVERTEVLVELGVPRARAEDVPHHTSLTEAAQWALGDRGPVEELLRGLEARDSVRALNAARGFQKEHAELLAQIIRGHLAGSTWGGLVRAPSGLLGAWCNVLSSVPAGPAARWGVMEILSV